MAKTLSVKQAAELAGVSERTIRNRIYSGEIRALKKQGKFGETYFIPDSEVLRSTAQEAALHGTAGRPLASPSSGSAETIAAADLANVLVELTNQVREQAEQIGRFKAIAERSESIETTVAQMQAERDRAERDKETLRHELAAVAAERDLLREQAIRKRRWFGLGKTNSSQVQVDTAPIQGSARA